MLFLVDVFGGGVPDESAHRLGGKGDFGVVEVFLELFVGQLELARAVCAEIAHDAAQLQAFFGFDDDTRRHGGNLCFVMLEKPQKPHPAVADQHKPFCSRRFRFCCLCIFHYFRLYLIAVEFESFTMTFNAAGGSR